MNLINTREDVKNLKLIFLFLGMLLILVIGAVDNLLTNTFKVAFSILPLKSLLVVSITFHGLILISLIYGIIAIIRSTISGIPKVSISLKALKAIGISFILIILLSSALNLYAKTYFNQEIGLSKVYIDSADLVYLTMVQSGLIFMRNIILFISFFLLLHKQK